MPDWLVDGGERVATTLAAVTVAACLVLATGWPTWAIIPVAGLVAAVVAAVAKSVGDPDTGGFHDPVDP